MIIYIPVSVPRADYVLSAHSMGVLYTVISVGVFSASLVAMAVVGLR